MNKELLEELKKHSVLCVEDEDGIRKRLVSILSYYFEDIQEASSGLEGFEIYSDYKPNIVFTDIQMNNGDGVELIKKIRENDSSTKIVVLTAYSSEEYLYNLINLNINHYLLKPLNAATLKEVLKKLVKEKVSSYIELYDDVFLDFSSREFKYKEENILLRKRERDFLMLLHENRNRCVTSYNQIEDKIWENADMTSNALKTFIRHLRNKLPIDIIINIPQEGYKLK
jgi:DNA-binding response OmpR family regulator